MPGSLIQKVKREGYDFFLSFSFSFLSFFLCVFLCVSRVDCEPYLSLSITLVTDFMAKRGQDIKMATKVKHLVEEVGFEVVQYEMRNIPLGKSRAFLLLFSDSFPPLSFFFLLSISL